MKQILFSLFIILSLSQAFAQVTSIKGKVVDAKSGNPMPFVNITVNGGRIGTASDIDGKFSITIQAPIQHLDFSFIGYTKKKVSLSGSETYIKVEMVEEVSTLKEVSVVAGENPAHRIIRKAVKNKDLNNPEKIPAFNYKTYSKFFVTVNTDSMVPEPDTLEIAEADTSYTEIDSSEFEFVDFFDKQHIFMMETVTERKFLAPSRDNETILANRVSGFKNPLFSLIITQLQSFSFYGDYISIAGDKYLNPITRGSTRKYFFIIEDTTYNSAEDTVYIVSFRPKPNYGFQPLKGLVYINTSDWAIQNVIAEPAEDDGEGFRITIEQQYKRFGDHTWFPLQLNAEIILGNIIVGNAVPYARMRTYLKDVNLNAPLKRKDISRADMSIDEKAVDNADKILLDMRVDSLSAKEAETYRVIDSIGEAEDLDRRLRILTAFFRGTIPVYFVDLELDKFINYNRYEGVRLGAGGHTNFRMSEWFKMGGYFAYGFKDEVWKYGWDMETQLHKHSNLKLKWGYQFDIFETGGANFIQRKNGTLAQDNYRRLFIPQWDEAQKYFTSITYDPTPKLKGMLQFQRENRITIGDYLYNYQRATEPVLQNGFNYTEVIASMRYAPNEKYIEGTEFGNINYSRGYPIVYLQYTRGLNNVLDGNFNYNKVDFKMEYRRQSVSFGESVFELKGGTVLDDVPFSKLYAGTSNMINSSQYFDRVTVSDRSSFETMRFNEFLMDSYIHLMWRQDFRSLFFRRGKFAPHIEVVSRAIWGDLRSPELHENISTQDLSDIYYESGIELNKLYETWPAGFGLGFYYRYGPYSLPNFEDNFAVKLTSKFSF